MAAPPPLRIALAQMIGLRAETIAIGPALGAFRTALGGPPAHATASRLRDAMPEALAGAPGHLLLATAGQPASSSAWRPGTAPSRC